MESTRYLSEPGSRYQLTHDLTTGFCEIRDEVRNVVVLRTRDVLFAREEADRMNKPYDRPHAA